MDVDREMNKTTGLVRKIDYKLQVTEIEKKTDIANMAIKVALNAKSMEIENKYLN